MLLLGISLLVLLAGCSKQPPQHRPVSSVDGKVALPLSGIDDGKAHFYTYRHDGKRVNFFVRTDSTGTLSANFDACFTCYKHKKGYRQEGTHLVCNECRMRFRLADEKWDNSSGCSPILIRSSVMDNALIIQASDMEKGAKLFR